MDEMDYARPLPWNLANNTKLAVWEWLAENPREQGAFNDFMFVQATGLAGFTEKFPLEEYLQVADQTDRIQFVDVGGGSGHISRAVLEKFPSLRGKIAVEDREDAGTVTRADFAKEGLQRIAYDFFTEQPLKGAKAYYMRNILHNWPTDKCKIILERLRDAMAPDSVILVDDIVVPLKGSHWYTTHMDLMMLTNLGAVERTEKQFNELFDSVGLKLEKLVRYNSFGPAIQAVVRK
jgi:demethylsterigmatocystin 6-O-methyltransferase